MDKRKYNPSPEMETIEKLMAVRDELRQQNAELLEVVKLTYRKHVLDDRTIGWNELEIKLFDCLCDVMGADEYIEWTEKVTGK